MSPEYAMKGLFSIKSDVFSFGIILLEIISGKRNNYYSDCYSMTLIEHVSKECLFFLKVHFFSSNLIFLDIYGPFSVGIAHTVPLEVAR